MTGLGCSLVFRDSVPRVTVETQTGRTWFLTLFRYEGVLVGRPLPLPVCSGFLRFRRWSVVVGYFRLWYDPGDPGEVPCHTRRLTDFFLCRSPSTPTLRRSVLSVTVPSLRPGSNGPRSSFFFFFSPLSSSSLHPSCSLRPPRLSVLHTPRLALK